MSRIRSVHPGLWTDEAFVSLPPLARLFFMGLWNECDDAGSFEWSPLKLKMRLLPGDNADAGELLDGIKAEGCIMQYEIDGRSYGAVRNFCQYQRPKKPNSVHPQTPEVRNFVGTEARSSRNGSEGGGKRLPTGGEKPRQMEDGGGRREEKPPLTPPNGSELKLPDDVRAVMEAGNYAAGPPGDLATLKSWYAAGADLEQDVLPVIRRETEALRRKGHGSPRTLKIFDAAIREKLAADATEIEHLRKVARRNAPVQPP